MAERKDSPTERRRELLAGMRATLPLMAGVVPFGIIFGALSVAGGIPAGIAGAMSAFVFAGSAQLIAAGLLSSGAGIVVVVTTTFFVNLRHNLYAATLAPHVRNLPQRWLLALVFWLTDETYLVVIRRYAQHDRSPYKHWFHLGSALTMYGSWQASTWLGIWAGGSIPNPAGWGLDFALPATFIGMLVPLIRGRSMLVCVTVAGALSLALNTLPNQFGMVIAVCAGALAGSLTQRLDITAPNRQRETAAS